MRTSIAIAFFLAAITATGQTIVRNPFTTNTTIGGLSVTIGDAAGATRSLSRITLLANGPTTVSAALNWKEIR